MRQKPRAWPAPHTLPSSRGRLKNRFSDGLNIFRQPQPPQLRAWLRHTPYGWFGMGGFGCSGRVCGASGKEAV
ncbi:hypothetical protein [Neisseria bacilliformis]|uniref:hypothetical protein n=1 Tax=Neisseria bacilliformis TaxID=267212 RepID=UPI000ADD41E9|nr:hypothetical protein [Neisseria bacilliformis]